MLTVGELGRNLTSFSPGNCVRTLMEWEGVLSRERWILLGWAETPVQFGRSVVSNSLQPHELSHIRLPCPPPTPRACSNLCPFSQWCHLTISSCHPLLLPPSIFPSIWVLSNESVLHIRWPKYWSFSFSISPSSEYSGLISFRIDWFDLLAVQGTLST